MSPLLALRPQLCLVNYQLFLTFTRLGVSIYSNGHVVFQVIVEFHSTCRLRNRLVLGPISRRLRNLVRGVPSLWDLWRDLTRCLDRGISSWLLSQVSFTVQSSLTAGIGLLFAFSLSCRRPHCAVCSYLALLDNSTCRLDRWIRSRRLSGASLIALWSLAQGLRLHSARLPRREADASVLWEDLSPILALRLGISMNLKNMLLNFTLNWNGFRIYFEFSSLFSQFSKQFNLNLFFCFFCIFFPFPIFSFSSAPSQTKLFPFSFLFFLFIFYGFFFPSYSIFFNDIQLIPTLIFSRFLIRSLLQMESEAYMSELENPNSKSYRNFVVK